MAETSVFIEAVKFNSEGLVPAIAQQYDTGEVLMMAWMNAESIKETLESGRVVYWSRSRQSFWRKGDTSGHIQTVKEVRLDCDGDTILLIIDQIGHACHHHVRTCFFQAGTSDGSLIKVDPVYVPTKLSNF